MEIGNEEFYKEYSIARSKYTEKVLASESPRRIIIAGPGTGKSYLFQEICRKNIDKGANKILTLSFINELVDDLSKDLEQLSEVRTLHSLSLGLFPGDSKMFLYLGKIIENDYELIKGKIVDYNYILCNLINDQEALSFYSDRRKYYNFFSPNCSVFTLIKYFDIDKNRIPIYDQLLIDEYQDFNTLEVSLLSRLSEKSPVLIVGDDDQSLYDFKYAIPDDIRNKNLSSEYESFELPYCSRCTSVTIDAYNKLVDVAKSKGYLSSRASKKVLYFRSKEKDEISTKHKKIAVKKNVFQTTLAYNVDNEIKKLFNPRDDSLPSVLIICPIRKQIEKLEKALTLKGYRNIDASQKYSYDDILEGANLLLNDNQCNLGWRILFQEYCIKQNNEDRFKQVLEQSITSSEKFLKLLEVDERKYIKQCIAILRKIRSNKEVTPDELQVAIDFLNYDPNQITLEKISTALDQSLIGKNIYKDTSIKIVTILGSKGLTRDVTFLVNFDDKYLLERDGRSLKITDTSICKFLVSLTRATTKTYIFTSESKYPTYVDWIGNEYLNEI